VRTNDLVLLSFIEALLREQDIDYVVLDSNMSILEGSLGILPRRIMVVEGNFARAGQILAEAGLEKEISRDKRGD
jgi:hypothetical protein